MGGDSGSSESTTTQEPWEPIQGPLKDIYKATENMWSAGAGPQVFPGDRVAPWSQPTQEGILSAAQKSGSGQGLGDLLNQQFGNNIATGGFNDPMMESAQGMYDMSQGAGRIDPSKLFAIGGQAMGSPYGAQLQGIADSWGGTNYMKQYTEDMATAQPGGVNPYFQQSLNHQLENVGNKVAGYMSGAGRYGSGAMGKAMGSEMGGVAASALSNQFNADATRRLQAAQGIQTADQQGIANVFGANAADLQRSGFGLQAEGAGRNIQADNINRQFSATDKLGSLGQAGNQNLQSYGQIAPGVDDLRYADLDRQFKIGSKIEDYQQKIMDDSANRFNEQNMLPWKYAEMMSQMLQPSLVNLGSSTTNSSQKTDFNPMSLLGIPMALAGGK